MAPKTQKRQREPTELGNTNDRDLSVRKTQKTTGSAPPKTFTQFSLSTKASSNSLPKKKKPESKRSTKTTKATKLSKSATVGQRMYSEALNAINSKVEMLDKRCEKQDSNNKFGINSDDYVDAMASFLPQVRALAQSDGEDDGKRLALILLLHLAEHTYADFELGFRMCGCGEGEKSYEELDATMIEIIEQLGICGGLSAAAPTAVNEAFMSKAKPRWDRDRDGDVGVFKTGRPNKQQRGQLRRQKVAWEKERLKVRREEREAEGADLVRVALAQLKDNWAWIEDYGIECYFPKSIERLEELLAARQRVEVEAPAQGVEE